MIIYTTSLEYETARYKLEQYETAAKAYMTANKTNGIPIDICATFPFANEVSNDMRSAIELYEFINNPPQKYFLYIDEQTKTATTWTGQKLGDVSFGRSYKSNLGDSRQPITITAINGLTYYGIYYKSSGGYARIKKSKQNK